MNRQQAEALAAKLAAEEAEGRTTGPEFVVEARQQAGFWTLHADGEEATSWIEVITNEHGNAIVRLSGTDEDTVVWTEPGQCFSV